MAFSAIDFTPPAAYSELAAHKAISPVPDLVQAARDNITSYTAGTVPVKVANDWLNALARQFAVIKAAYDGGELDGSAEWKTKAGLVMADLGTILTPAQPISQTYAERVGNKIASEAALGNVISLTDAQQAELVDAADITTIITAVNAALA